MPPLRGGQRRRGERQHHAEAGLFSKGSLWKRVTAPDWPSPGLPVLPGVRAPEVRVPEVRVPEVRAPERDFWTRTTAFAPDPVDEATRSNFSSLRCMAKRLRGPSSAATCVKDAKVWHFATAATSALLAAPSLRSSQGPPRTWSGSAWIAFAAVRASWARATAFVARSSCNTSKVNDPGRIAFNHATSPNCKRSSRRLAFPVKPT